MAVYIHHEDGWRTKVSESWVLVGYVNLTLQRHLFWKFWTSISEHVVIPSMREGTVSEVIDRAVQTQVRYQLQRDKNRDTLDNYFKENS